MKKIIPAGLLISTIAVSIIIFSSCYYDKASQLYPFTGTCDTAHVTYSITIVSVLQNGGCFSCHGGTAASGGNIILDNYASLKTVAQSGRLYGAVNHSPGYRPMPLGGNKLTNCDISKIKKWIDMGTPNN